MVSLIYFLLIFCMISVESFRTRRTRIDFLSTFTFVYFLMYPLTGILLELNIMDAQSSELNYHDFFYQSKIETAFAILLGYILIVLGFLTPNASKTAQKVTIIPRPLKNVLYLSIFLVVISFVSILFYSAEFGGLFTALANTQFIRDQVKGFEGGSMVLFKHFMAFSIFATYLLCSIIFLGKTDKYRKIALILLTISFTLAVIACVLDGSRGIVVTFFVGFYITYVILTGSFALPIALPSLIVMLLYISYGKPLTFSLTALPDGFDAVIERFQEHLANEKGDGSLDPLKFLKNFAFGFHSIDVVFESEYELRYGLDFFYAVAQLLPERLLGLAVPETVSYINSQLVLGTSHEPHFTVPPACLAFFMYSLSWPGLVFMCFLYGWIGRFVETLLIRYLNTILWIPMLYFITMKIWVEYAFTGDPRISLMANFWNIPPLLMLFLICARVEVNQKVK
jgi:hypothetical protein